MSIGGISEATGVNIEIIPYYEKAGLMQAFDVDALSKVERPDAFFAHKSSRPAIVKRSTLGSSTRAATFSARGAGIDSTSRRTNDCERSRLTAVHGLRAYIAALFLGDMNFFAGFSRAPAAGEFSPKTRFVTARLSSRRSAERQHEALPHIEVQINKR